MVHAHDKLLQQTNNLPKQVSVKHEINLKQKH